MFTESLTWSSRGDLRISRREEDDGKKVREPEILRFASDFGPAET